MKPENLEKSIKNIRLKTSAALDERILTAAEAELDQAMAAAGPAPQPGTRRWGKIAKSDTTKYLAAAAAIIVLLLGIAKLIPDRTSSGPEVSGTTPQIEATPDPFINEPPLAVAEDGKAPLEIKLPKPVFEGTPPNLKGIENVEPYTNKLRPPFLAPVGTRNVALNRPVVSSDNDPIIGKLEWITDGDKAAAEGSFVELSPFPQHITIDLGTQYKIYAVVVWHYHKEARIYQDVVVQVGDDADMKDNARVIFNNDIDNSLGLGAGRDKNYVESYQGKLIDARGQTGRYLRLHSNGSTAGDLNHYIEVEVYGLPVE